MNRGVILSLVLFSAGCAASPDYWPTENWRTSAPEGQGMDSETLIKLIDYIEENDLNIHSITIIRNGCTLFERSFMPVDQVFTGALGE